MDEKETLANNLTKFRKQSGLSQLELAKKLNYSNKNISKWEKGETVPSVFILEKIAKIYGITLEELISGQTQQAPPQTPNTKQKNIRKTLFRVIMLLLANAILYAVGTTLIYAFHLASIEGFNVWLIYLYLSPLTFLSITIYIRVIYKFVDLISLSLFVWLICLSFYLSFIHVKYMALIFAVGGIFQIIELCIALLVNIKIKPKKKKVQDEN